MTGIIDETACG